MGEVTRDGEVTMDRESNHEGSAVYPVMGSEEV